METVTISRKLTTGETQHIPVIVEKARLSKTFLNKIIKWSSSRYESWKKKEVVDHIFNAMKEGHSYSHRMNGDKWEKVPKYSDYFHSGSYCECSSMTRKGTYYIDYTQKVILDCNDKDTGEINQIYAAYKFN